MALSVHVAARFNVDTLLLCVVCRVLFVVAKIRGLVQRFHVISELDSPLGKDRLKLAVHDDISVTARWVGEMSVHRHIEGVVLALLVGRARTDKVLSTLHSLGQQSFHSLQ